MTTDSSKSTGLPEARDLITALFGSEVRCTMDDGRIVSGKLLCLDRLKNMILHDVVEIRRLPQQLHLLGTDSKNVSEATDTQENVSLCERKLIHAMVPGKRLVKVEVKESIWENSKASVRIDDSSMRTKNINSIRTQICK